MSGRIELWLFVAQRAVTADAGCHACHGHHSCAAFCPVELNPTASIAGLKRATAAAALRGAL